MIRPREGKRGTSYQVRVWSHAQQKMVPVGTVKTLKEAKALERRAGLEHAGGGATPTTVRQYAATWLQAHPRPQATTNQTYSEDIARFVRDFGTRKLSSIGRREAREWAVRQPRNAVNVTRTFFNDAIDDEVVTSNPFANLRLKQSRGRRDITALTEPELDALAGCAHKAYPDSPYASLLEAMVLFSGWVACRPAELFDVDRHAGKARCADGQMHPASCIDWERGVVHINGQRRPDGTRVPHTKNGRRRVVVVAARVMDALANVEPFPGQPALFYTASGQRFSRSSHYHYWKELRSLGGLPGMDYYELRHFGATELLRQGASHADVAVHLGHTDGGALVMSTYGHPEDDAARDRLAKILRPEAA